MEPWCAVYLRSTSAMNTKLDSVTGIYTGLRCTPRLLGETLATVPQCDVMAIANTTDRWWQCEEAIDVITRQHACGGLLHEGKLQVCYLHPCPLLAHGVGILCGVDSEAGGAESCSDSISQKIQLGPTTATVCACRYASYQSLSKVL